MPENYLGLEKTSGQHHLPSRRRVADNRTPQEAAGDDPKWVTVGTKGILWTTAVLSVGIPATIILVNTLGH